MALKKLGYPDNIETYINENPREHIVLLFKINYKIKNIEPHLSDELNIHELKDLIAECSIEIKIMRHLGVELVMDGMPDSEDHLTNMANTLAFKRKARLIDNRIF